MQNLFNSPVFLATMPADAIDCTTMTSLLASERRAAASLAAIFAIRMLGLFMILPVLSLSSKQFVGATPSLMGLAMGIYGLSQACLQLPFGMLSDRFGRKTMITLGLCVFALGSVVAANSHSITMLIIGRTIQGAGAIGSPCIALLADLTRAEQRSKAMAMLGMSIGLTFALAMVLGPLFYGWVGLRGIFWLIAALAVLALLVLWALVPTPNHLHFHRDSEADPKQLRAMLCDSSLWRLYLGIACLHASLTALFTRLPVLFTRQLGLLSAHHWQVYLPVMAAGFVAMLPLMIMAERQHQHKNILACGIALLGLAMLALATLPMRWMPIIISLWLFFTGFNLLEALLPSLVSKMAPVGRRGTAIGIYSTAQFMGIFVGGASAGWLQQHTGPHALWWLLACLIGVWLVVTLRMPKVPVWRNHTINLQDTPLAEHNALLTTLKKMLGIKELMFDDQYGIAYLKINTKMITATDINQQVDMFNKKATESHHGQRHQ